MLAFPCSGVSDELFPSVEIFSFPMVMPADSFGLRMASFTIFLVCFFSYTFVSHAEFYFLLSLQQAGLACSCRPPVRFSEAVHFFFF